MAKPEKHPSFFKQNTAPRLFGAFVLLHLVAWTLVPWLTSFNAPLDVIEGYAWGREWLIGTHKHPPMQAWWLEILAIISGRAPWAHYFASQLAIVIAFWAVWQTGRRITDDGKALLGVLLLEGIVYYNFTSPEFNPNVLQLPFWALACWSFHRAVKGNRWFDWSLLGLWAAAGLYTKYSMTLILGLLLGLLVFTPEGRQRLRRFGPYLTLAITFALFVPHFNWLAIHDFLPFTYAQSRTSQAVAWYQHLTYPLGFFAATALALAPAAVLFLVFSGRRLPLYGYGARELISFDRIFLHVVALGPITVLLLLSIILGFRPRDMWGACLWNFIGLWAICFLSPIVTLAHLRRFAFTWASVFILGIVAIISSNIVGVYFTQTPLRVQFPGQALAEKIIDKWQKITQKPSPAYVIGDTWLAGNISYYTPTPFTSLRPRVFIHGDSVISLWINPIDVKREGGILVWCSNRCADIKVAENIPSYLIERFPDAQIQQPLTLSWQTAANMSPLFVGWAVLPPGR